VFGIEGAAGLALGAAAIMAAVHVASPWLVFLDRTPRSIWLSIAGGVSVAYVFVHLLPELARLQREHFGEHQIESFLYLFAVSGLVAYYGLEQLAKQHGGGSGSRTPALVFWLHLSSFGLYNLLIGYLLHEQARLEGIAGMGLYAGAMALHFVVNDRALYHHHGELYTRRGRWILAAGTLAGWGLGLRLEIGMTWIAAAVAFLAGSVVLNVIKEELPEERESRFWAFALGTAAYAGLLVI
jgi:hypothetical protein